MRRVFLFALIGIAIVVMGCASVAKETANLLIPPIFGITPREQEKAFKEEVAALLQCNTRTFLYDFKKTGRHGDGSYSYERMKYLYGEPVAVSKDMVNFFTQKNGMIITKPKFVLSEPRYGFQATVKDIDNDKTTRLFFVSELVDDKANIYTQRAGTICKIPDDIAKKGKELSDNECKFLNQGVMQPLDRERLNIIKSMGDMGKVYKDRVKFDHIKEYQGQKGIITTEAKYFVADYGDTKLVYSRITGDGIDLVYASCGQDKKKTALDTYRKISEEILLQKANISEKEIKRYMEARDKGTTDYIPMIMGLTPGKRYELANDLYRSVHGKNLPELKGEEREKALRKFAIQDALTGATRADMLNTALHIMEAEGFVTDAEATSIRKEILQVLTQQKIDPNSLLSLDRGKAQKEVEDYLTTQTALNKIRPKEDEIASIFFSKVGKLVSTVENIVGNCVVAKDITRGASFGQVEVSKYTTPLFNQRYTGSNINCLDGSGTFVNGPVQADLLHGIVRKVKYLYGPISVVVTATGNRINEGFIAVFSDGTNSMTVMLSRREELITDVHLQTVGESTKLAIGDKGISIKQNELINMLNKFYSEKVKKVASLDDFAVKVITDNAFTNQLISQVVTENQDNKAK